MADKAFNAKNGVSVGTSLTSVIDASGNWTGNAIAGTITSTDDTTTNASVYPLWQAAAGSGATKVSTTKLSLNPSTGTLTSVILSSSSDSTFNGVKLGKGVGNVSGNVIVASGTSLSGNTTGQYITAVGDGALNGTTANYNSGFGYSAGSVNTSGIQNTWLGALTNSGLSNYSNSTAVGYNAQIGASNQIVLGNSSVTTLITTASIQCGSISAAVSTLTIASTQSITPDPTAYSTYKITMNTTTVALTINAVAGVRIGQTMNFIIIQGGSTPSTFTWASGTNGYVFANNNRAIDTAVNSKTVVSAIFDGVQWLCSLAKGFA